MSTAVADRVRDIVEPLLAAKGLEIVDVEHAGGSLRVTVDRPGGVDLEAVSQATKLVSRALDEADPIPGRYTLEVSSPGLERRLRTADHFARAVSEKVSVKLLPGAEERRLTGMLAAADDSGFELRLEDGDERWVAYDQVETARTVFEWGPGPKPGKPAKKAKKEANR